ncbi:defense response [Chamberlinius hualienensis]
MANNIVLICAALCFIVTTTEQIVLLNTYCASSANDVVHDCIDINEGPIWLFTLVPLTSNVQSLGGNYCRLKNVTIGNQVQSNDQDFFISWTSCGKNGCKMTSHSLVEDDFYNRLEVHYKTYFDIIWNKCQSSEYLENSPTSAVYIKRTVFHLDLSGSDIVGFPEYFFCDLNELTLLYLNETSLNDSTKLGLKPFDKRNISTTCCLCSLKHLNLDENNFSVIKTESFSELKTLEELNLTLSNIETIEKSAFTQMKNLKSLRLSKNHLTTLDDSAFTGLNSLEYLDLSDNQLANISLDALFSLEVLKWLLLARNNLSNLTNGLFDNKRWLEGLELQHNKINFTKGTFRSLTNLKHLDLSFNHIGKLPADMFNSSKALRKLILSNNNISVLPANLFNGLIKLECLYLENNRLTTLTENVFNDLNKLQVLDLSNNQISQIPIGIFIYLLNLKKLLLSDNNIRCIPDGAVNYLKKESNGQLNNGLSKLIYLDLSNNLIEEIHYNSLTNLKNVQTILLSKNRINSLPIYLFSSQKALVKLDLQSNRMHFISKKLFSQLINLHHLNLSNNQINNIEDDALKSLISLTSLALSDNCLTNYPIWNIANLTHLKRLGIHRNTWSCDCNYIKNFTEFYKTFANIVENAKDLYCQNEGNANDKTSMIGLDMDHCYLAFNYTVVWAPLLCLICLSAFIAILVFRFRYETQVLIYSHYGLRFGSNKVDNTEKLFDVFISYSCLDEDFLVNTLLPGLENIEKPYNLCLHHRNFAPGAYIINSIMEAVEQSAVTLILLSNNFLQSEWCRFEFKMAHIQMLKDKCKRVIVIIVDDDIPNDLDPEMKLYMKTKTYLHFNDKLFWKKIYFALPEPKNYCETTL